LEHKEPDRVPLDLGGMMTTIEAGAYDPLKSLLGIESETKRFMREHVAPDEHILETLGIDTRYVRMNPLPNLRASNKWKDSYVDEWGIVWKKPKGSLYYDPVGFPLDKVQTIGDLNGYNFPNPRNPRRVEGLREKAQALYRQSNYAIIADAPQQGIFETAFLLRGLSNFLEDLALREEFAKALLSRICDYMIDLYGMFLTEVGEYVQVVFTGDDIGMQPQRSLELTHLCSLILTH
jgi:uroporphyrinogen decarboxylase